MTEQDLDSQLRLLGAVPDKVGLERQVSHAYDRGARGSSALSLSRTALCFRL